MKTGPTVICTKGIAIRQMTRCYGVGTKNSLGSRGRHICNGRGMCVATISNLEWSMHILTYYHTNEHGQRFTVSDLLSHPGFYVIQNDYGLCLSVDGDTNQTGAPIWVNHCNPANPSQAGQRWKWL